MGYEIFQTWELDQRWKWGESYIVFVQAEDKFFEVPYHRCRVRLNHLAFHAESKEQVDKMTKELKHRCVNILYSKKHPFAGGEEHYAVYFENPDRIKVELVAPE